MIEPILMEHSLCSEHYTQCFNDFINPFSVHNMLMRGDAGPPSTLTEGNNEF